MLLLYRCLSELLALILWVPGRYWAFRGDATWRDRLGLRKLESADVWLHGASVGEVRLLSCLCNFLLAREPALKLHVSVMTRTGLATARSLLPGVALSVIPLDVPRLMRRQIEQLRPRAIVCAEVEIWPALLGAAQARAVPVVLVNARLKDRSFRRFARFARTMRRLLGRYDRFFLRSAQDRERYLALGASEEACVLAGDMKFDAPAIDLDPAIRDELRARLGCDPADFLFVCGSTRPDEEQQLAPGLRALLQKEPRLRVVIAPRHVERCNEVAAILTEAGLAARLYSEAEAQSGVVRNTAQPQVVLVDALGVLGDLYSAGDAAFVGGTLTNTGGHNILEPVWRGRPVLFGPDVTNIGDAAAYVLEHGYGEQVADATALLTVLEHLMAGRVSYAVRTDSSSGKSAVALAGEYILSTIRQRDS